jgi:hypothetical protein
MTRLLSIRCMSMQSASPHKTLSSHSHDKISDHNRQGPTNLSPYVLWRTLRGTLVKNVIPSSYVPAFSCPLSSLSSQWVMHCYPFSGFCIAVQSVDYALLSNFHTQNSSQNPHSCPRESWPAHNSLSEHTLMLYNQHKVKLQLLIWAEGTSTLQNGAWYPTINTCSKLSCRLIGR